MNFTKGMTMKTISRQGIPWVAEIDGEDVIVRDVQATAFGGGGDRGDDGKTESGVMNDGRDPHLMGCALPIRSNEMATRNSPLACSYKPHIPWHTKVRVWVGNDESRGVDCTVIDNGPNVMRFTSHAFDATVAVARALGADGDNHHIANCWGARVSYRIFGAAQYLADK